MRRLSELKRIPIEEIAQGPNREFSAPKMPSLFEQWWEEYSEIGRSYSRKVVARDAWTACAKSLGVYDEPATIIEGEGDGANSG